MDRKKSYLHCVSTPPVALRKESVDRKTSLGVPDIRALRSLSARRAWIEKSRAPVPHLPMAPSLSARRAWIEKPTSGTQRCWNWVALRKESVDRKIDSTVREDNDGTVALRKESVDRKFGRSALSGPRAQSLSARRAWIEIFSSDLVLSASAVALRKEGVDRNINQGKETRDFSRVALRKEGVDRNSMYHNTTPADMQSLSARRAWIEIQVFRYPIAAVSRRSPQGERG